MPCCGCGCGWLICSGVRYLRFDTGVDKSVEELGTYLALQSTLHENNKKKETGYLLEKTYLEVIRYCLSELDFSKCEPAPTPTTGKDGKTEDKKSGGTTPSGGDKKVVVIDEKDEKKGSGGGASASQSQQRAQVLLNSIFTSQVLPPPLSLLLSYRLSLPFSSLARLSSTLHHGATNTGSTII